MSSRNGYIDDKIYDYILDNSLRDLPVLAQLRQETQEMPSGGMQVSPDQGQFMGLLVQLAGARKIVEVGTFTGYSSTVMALALPDDGRLVACDMSEEYTNVARRYWQEAGVADKIELRLGLGGETLAAMLAAGELRIFSRKKPALPRPTADWSSTPSTPRPDPRPPSASGISRRCPTTATGWRRWRLISRSCPIWAAHGGT